MQHELDAPAPGRFCRLQILAFLVLNLLGSCVHMPADSVKASASPAVAESALSAEAANVAAKHSLT